MDPATRTDVLRATSALLDYLALRDAPEPADVVWGLGSHEPRVAEHAADLFLRGFAPMVVFSGGKGHRWNQLDRSEADLFAAVAIARGVPADRIILETRSTNTAENILFTSGLFRDHALTVGSALLITIPPFQRRASLTLGTHRPDIRCINSPIDWGVPSGWTDDQLALVARLAAGEISRLREYPARGFLRWDPSLLPESVLDLANTLAPLSAM